MITFSLQPSAFNLAFLAMGQPPQGGDPRRNLLQTMGPLLLIAVVFYLILIRPQQKQQNELKKMLDALKVGDKVIITGGIYGMVSQVKEKSVIVKIAENTKVEMLRSGIQSVVKEEKPTA